MEKAIKQRLLGGLVLVAGAALFLPILLDGAGSQLIIPPMPAAPRVPTVEAIAPALEKKTREVGQAVDAAHEGQTVSADVPPATVASASATGAQDVAPDPAAAPAVAAAAAVVTTAKPVAPAAKPAPVPEKAVPEKTVPVAAAHPAAEPAVKKVVESAAKKVAEPAKPAPAPEKKTVSEARPVPDAKPAAEPTTAWVVQVASLSSRDKADALLQRLRKKGFHALMHQQGGEWKVLVGPELRKELAESAKQRLSADADLKLNGWLQPYKP